MLATLATFPAVPPADIALRYGEFLGYFAIYGALGFRLVSTRLAGYGDTLTALYTRIRTSAASIGAAGAALLLLDLALTAARHTTKAHPTALDALQHPLPKTLIPIIFAALVIPAFLAARRFAPVWVIAGLLSIGFLFRNITNHRWSFWVNPIHELGAFLWLGTLFVLIAVALPAIWRCPLPPEQRRTLIAHMVARFSPFALIGAAVMVVTGIMTSWIHLPHLSDLWLKPYGWTLVTKLVLVLIVFALGARNWRSISPQLHTDEAGYSLHRSSIYELGFTAAVLLVTAVLVLL